MRTWEVPAEPDETVQAVRDSTGDLWRRTGSERWQCVGQGVNAWIKDLDESYCLWGNVMAYAPLRETTQESEARAAVGPVHITDEAVIAAIQAIDETGPVVSAPQVDRALIAALKALGFEVAE